MKINRFIFQVNFQTFFLVFCFNQRTIKPNDSLYWYVFYKFTSLTLTQ